MAKVTAIKDFSKAKSLIAPFNLNEAQLKSYQWFLEKGLDELLHEISPIRDHTGKEFELYFVDYRFDEPKYDEATARYKEATYEAPLRCTCFWRVSRLRPSRARLSVCATPYATPRPSAVV